MNLTAIKNLMTGTLTAFGNQVFIILSACLGVAIAYYLFKFSWHLIKGTTGTNWAWLDRHTYKPYKGYNRLRSRKWNLAHTMDNTGMGYHRMSDGFLIKD
jgi:hypothetical protein